MQKVFTGLFFALSLVCAQAQITLFDADFSGNGSTSGSASGAVGGTWTSNGINGCPGGFFGTRNGVFEITDYEGSGCTGNQGGSNDSQWRATVNIRNYVNVSVLVEVSGVAGGDGFEATPSQCVPAGSQDCIDQLTVRVSYSGNSFSQQYRTNSNTLSGIFDEAQGICGNQLTILIVGGTQAADESFFINRVTVFGEAGSPPIALNRSLELCEGQNGLLRVGNVSNDADIIWLDGEGDEIRACEDNPTCPLARVSPDDTGLYAALVADPNSGCFDPVELEFEVLVFPALTPPARMRVPEGVCSGRTVNLAATPTGNDFEYTWVGPDGEEITRCRNQATCPIENVQFENQGLYLVQILDPSLGECGVGEAEGELFIAEGPGRVTVSDTDYCIGQTATLTVDVENEGDYIYTWVRGSDNQELTANADGSLTIPDLVAVDEGLYFLLITDESGSCETEVFVELTLDGDFETSISGQTQICSTETTNLTANSGENYVWSNGATSSTVEVGSGNYSVTITSENGCEKVETVSVEAFPDFTTSISGETQVCADEMTDLTANGGENYVWSNGATSSTVEVGSGNYSVTITSENGCEKV
ncbi:MAG: hypothetical protein AAGI23_20205, partial [Bacteroidota bacterium]